MKVLLIRDIPKLGKRGQIVDANDGYARNFLIPRKYAISEGGKEAQAIHAELKTDERQKRLELKHARRIAEIISSKTIEISKTANEKGHLYAGISPEEIAKAINQQLRIDCDPARIEIIESIKRTGNYKISFLCPEGEIKFTLNVVSRKT